MTILEGFFADLIMFAGGAAAILYDQKGEPWYMIMLMIVSCIFTSDILRSPTTEAK